MKRIIFVFISLVTFASMFFVLSITKANEAPDNKETIQERAHSIASEIVSNYGVSGIQYAINDNGSINLSDSAGVYDKATNAPITKDTMFGIGSVSKMYVTAATMMLVDSNKLDLDKPLTTYIKDFTMSDERYKEITPRMLMNHSSGLYGTHYGNSMLFDDNDTQNHDQLLLKLQSSTLKSKPGAYSVYCNDGFQLLEILVEQVSGLSYTEFLETYIRAPLNLSSTKTPLDNFDRQRLAKTYFPTNDKALPVENANVIGTGGVYSTAEELSMFSEVLLGKQPDILSEESARSMQSPEYKKGVWVSDETNTINYGLGWDAVSFAPFNDYGITALSKGGDTTMYHAVLIAIPEYNISIAVLSSGGSSIFNTIFASNLLLEYLKDKGIIKDILPDITFEPPKQVEMPSDMLSYFGLYGTVDSTINIEISNGELKLPELGGLIPAQPYVYIGNGQFKSGDGSAVVSFDNQTNGKTYLKLNGYLDFPGIGQMGMVTYEYQKLDNNPINDTTKEVWEKRNGKSYYAMDEKITSVFYLEPSILIKNISVDLDHGYANGTKIIDQNKAVNAVEIPIAGGRDVFDLNFHIFEQEEYLEIDGFSYISEDAIKPINVDKSSISIKPGGHARWYKIDEKSANQVMTVAVPTSGGFAVYDKEGTNVNFSRTSDSNSVVLPEDGLIVFGGNVGDVFKISLDNNQD